MWRKDRYPRKQSLVSWPGHHSAWCTLRSAIHANDDYRRAQVLEEVPSFSGNREEIKVIARASQYLESRVMLEEEVRFDTDTANILEHMRRLHVVGIGPITIETVLC